MNKAALKYLFGVLASVGAIVGILRLFFVTPVVITDDGMAPTLLAGETVLMWNSTSTPDFGDLLVCRHPAGSGFVVGRFVARPGMLIVSDRGQMKIDGRVPDRNIERTIPFTMHGDTQVWQVVLGVEEMGGEEHQFMQDSRAGFRIRETRVAGGIFLLGDNRLPHGFDSRTYGTVNPATCIGRIFMRWSVAEGRVEFDNGVLDAIN